MLQESRRLLAESIEAQQNHRQLEAEALVIDALTLDPENVEAWLRRAQVSARTEDRRMCLATVLRLAPGNEEARAALRAMEYPGGEAKLRRIIETGRARQEAGENRKAMMSWKAVLKFDPVNEEALVAVAQLLKARGEPTLTRFERALERNPDNATLAVYYAAALAETDRWDEVERVLDAIDLRALHTADALVQVGRMSIMLGEVLAAHNALERAVTLPDCDPLAHHDLAQLYEEAGRTDAALEAYRHVVDKAWGTPEASEAERRLRAIAPYLPRGLADSWLFILREAFGWVIFIGLLAVFDSGVRIDGMSASGVVAIGLGLVGGVCVAVAGISGDTLNLLGRRTLGDRMRRRLRVMGGALFVVAVVLSLFNSLGSTADYLSRRFG